LTLIKAVPVALLQAIGPAYSRGPINSKVRRMTTVSDTMHANAGTTTLTHRWRWLLVLGVVQIIAGSMAIAIPIVASFAAVAIFGAVLLVTAAQAARSASCPRRCLIDLFQTLPLLIGT